MPSRWSPRASSTLIRLAQQLERSGIEADAIHGNKNQNARTRTLKRFKDNELRVLVATDIAARGLDIEALPHVVNFDMPHVAEDYIHRIGRTGRAGAEGDAVSLVSNEERPLLAAIERLMNRKVEQRIVPGFEPGTAPHAVPQEPKRHAPQRHAPQRPGHGQRREQPRREQPRTEQQQYRRQRPTYNPAAAIPAAIAKERDAQMAEARARMEAEGEQPRPVSQERRPRQSQMPALLGGRKSGT